MATQKQTSYQPLGLWERAKECVSRVGKKVAIATGATILALQSGCASVKNAIYAPAGEPIAIESCARNYPQPIVSERLPSFTTTVSDEKKLITRAGLDIYCGLNGDVSNSSTVAGVHANAAIPTSGGAYFEFGARTFGTSTENSSSQNTGWELGVSADIKKSSDSKHALRAKAMVGTLETKTEINAPEFGFADRDWSNVGYSTLGLEYRITGENHGLSLGYQRINLNSETQNGMDNFTLSYTYSK